MSIRVLLVDDESAILDLYKLTLELEGFQVETSDSAAAAVRLLAHAYDLVITDMRMETPTSGFHVIRAATRMEPRPVIAVLSGFYLDEEDCRRSGTDAVFVKGMPVHVLAQALHDLLEARTQSQGGVRQLGARA